MLADLVRHTDVDVLMLAGRYTLLEQDSLDDLLPLCEARGVGSRRRRRLQQRPARAVAQPAHAVAYDYRDAPPEIVRRARAIAAVCERHGTTLPAAAIAFPLAHPAVSSVCVGARRPSRSSGTRRSTREPIAPDLWSS